MALLSDVTTVRMTMATRSPTLSRPVRLIKNSLSQVSSLRLREGTRLAPGPTARKPKSNAGAVGRMHLVSLDSALRGSCPLSQY